MCIVYYSQIKKLLILRQKNKRQPKSPFIYGTIQFIFVILILHCYYNIFISKSKYTKCTNLR